MVDGFYVEVVVCSLIGALWIRWARKQIHNLEHTNPSAFLVKQKPRVPDMDERTIPLVVKQSCSENPCNTFTTTL